MSIHFEISGKEEKFPLGPIIDPKPGPTLDIDVADAEIEVSISRPVKDKIRAIITKVTKKIKRLCFLFLKRKNTLELTLKVI